MPGIAAPAPFTQHPLNQAVAQTLPAPTNPDNRDLTFVGTPALPAGLRYVPPRKVGGAYVTGGQIVGTPTAPTLRWQYTLAVVDADNNEAQETFALATARGRPHRRRRIGSRTSGTRWWRGSATRWAPR